MTDRFSPRAINPEGVADGDYALTVAGGKVTGLAAASGGSGSGIVETIVPGPGIAVDSTDPANPIVSATGGGGGGGAETWDGAVAALTGKVHRWKFEESSGATAVDAIGSLPLTLSGTYTRGVTSLTGQGAALDGSTGYAATSGLGSIPVGATDRTIILLYRSSVADTSTPETSLFSYGTLSTRGLFETTTNVSTNRPNLYGQVGGTNAIMNLTPVADATWHLVALGSYSGFFTTLYFDLGLTQVNQSAVLNTTASGNFYVGQRVDGSRKSGIVVDDVIVCNKWVGKAALDRLYRALPAT